MKKLPTILSVSLVVVLLACGVLFWLWQDSQDEAQRREQEIAELKEKFTASTDEGLKLAARVENLSKSLQEVNSKLSSKENSLTDLETKLLLCQKNTADFDAQLSQEKLKAGELEKVLQEERSNWKSETDKAKSKLEEMNLSLQKKDEQLKAALQKNEQLDAALAKLNQTVTEKDAKNDQALQKFNEERSEWVQQTKEHQTVVKHLEDLLAATEKELEQLKSAKSSLESEIAQKSDELESRGTELAQAIQDKQQAVSETEKLKTTIAEKEKAVSELAAEVQDLTSQNKSLNQQLEKKTSDISELQKARGEEKQRSDAAVNDCTKSTQKLSDMLKQKQTALNQADLKLEEAADSIRTAQAAMTEKEQMNAELKDRLASCRQNLDSLQAQLKADQSTLKKLNADLSRLREEKGLALEHVVDLKKTYEALVAKFQGEISNQEITISELQDRLKVTFVDRILFDFASTSIRLEGKKVLVEAGDIIKNLKNAKIRIIGHTDDTPIASSFRWKFSTNWELSAARAASVAQFMIHNGAIDPANLEICGRAFYEPLASNQTAEGRAKNRRVEIIIVPQND